MNVGSPLSRPPLASGRSRNAQLSRPSVTPSFDDPYDDLDPCDLEAAFEHFKTVKASVSNPIRVEDSDQVVSCLNDMQ